MSTYEEPKVLAKKAEDIYSEISKKELKIKDRLQIPLQEMPARDPKKRSSEMGEVALGYTETQAKVEAERCLNCKNKPCVKGCPVGIMIPDFITEIQKGNFLGAVEIIKKTNLLPAICGRVCPQESQCQAYCTVGKSLKSVDKSVAIGRLERFVADYAREHNLIKPIEVKAETGKKVGIIGSGPAGLTVAADVRREGHDVTVFEALQKEGGVMIYGIPEFRLPKEIVANEVESLKAMGVKFRTNFLVGRTKTIDQLLKEFDAIFIGTGAGLPKFMGIEGENLIGVFSANEYLTRANLMKAYETEKASTPLYPAETVAVLGGGNVAMDAARTALRLGAKKVYCVYRRTRDEMPARLEEIAHAEEEGVQFHFLENPTKIIGNEDGVVVGMELLSYELGEPDDSGRRRPVAIPGTEHILDVDAVIVALGNNSNPLITHTTKDIETNKKGNIIVNDENQTSLARVWAGGDIVLGAATVILAMGEGRIAAKSINEYLAKN